MTVILDPRPVDDSPEASAIHRTRLWRGTVRAGLVPLADLADHHGISVNEAAYLVHLGKLPNAFDVDGQPHVLKRQVVAKPERSAA